MAWCYYCRRHTVNGRCPKCGRMYGEPNKSYDYYGKEIKSKSSSSSSSSSSYSSGGYSTSSGEYSGYYDEQEGSVASGFFLALPISFFAIIIAAKMDKSNMKKGAIIGTIVWAIVLLHVVAILLAIFYEHFGGDINAVKEWFDKLFEPLKHLFS